MRLFKYILIFIVLTPALAFGQGRNDVWYFGKGVGLNFNSSPPDTLMDGAIDTYEGSATICDSTGKLLYYTDGRTIWDSNHQAIPNGTGLNSSGSSIQAALIVQKPGDRNSYYVFTTYTSGDTYIEKHGLHYSVIKNGVVVQKNMRLNNSPTEWLAGYYNQTDDFYWIATITTEDLQLSDSAQLRIYKLSNAGISVHSVTNIPYVGTRGQLVFSPNGAYLGFTAGTLAPALTFPVSLYGKIFLYNFNVTNGAVSFRSSVSGVIRPMAMAFSPDSKLVYFGSLYENPLYQVPVDRFINDSLSKTYHNNISTRNVNFAGGLQLGSDGRIYCNVSSDNFFLSSIDYPNQVGPNCQFSYQSTAYRKETDLYGNALYNTRIGLPNAVSNLITQPQIEIYDSCAGLSLRCALNYSFAESVDWIMGDGQIIASGPDTFSYTYQEPGTYLVKVALHYPTHTDTFSKFIEILARPEPDLGQDTLMCKDEVLVFQIETHGSQTLTWENGNTSPNRTIDQEGQYRLNISNAYCSLEDTVKIVFTSCDIYSDSLCLGDRTHLWIEDQTVDSINWNFGDMKNELHPSSDVRHNYTTGGIYSVSAIIYKSGLERNASREIHITEMPQHFLPWELTGCDPVSFVPQMDNSLYDFSWSNGDRSAGTEFHSSGVYQLKIERNSCIAIDSMQVDIQNCICDVLMPNAFSPNDDLLNPVFGPTFPCEYSNAELVIYSLWGEQLTNGESSWDGTYKGAMCQPGTYLWILTYRDRKGDFNKLQGFVHLVR